MTKYEKRAEVLPNYMQPPDFYGVLAACQDVHGWASGSSESDPESIRLLVKFLLVVLETWDKPYLITARFDNAVQELVRATLHEARGNASWLEIVGSKKES